MSPGSADESVTRNSQRRRHLHSSAGNAMNMQPPSREIHRKVMFHLHDQPPYGLAARCCCGDDATDQERERCARVRFRAGAALHKAGVALAATGATGTGLAGERERGWCRAGARPVGGKRAS